jgi:hypothetical protein
VARVKSLLINYLASGQTQRARAKVGWIQCCQDKSQGGINLVNPEDAVTALMLKWIIKAMEPGRSNLHLMLRYRLSQYQSYARGRWEQSLKYFTCNGHQSRQGPLGWNRVTSAWKKMVPELVFVPPVYVEEFLSCSLWHCPRLPLKGPGFSRVRATELHKAGLRRYRDAWQEGQFISAAEARRKYGLKQEEEGAWSTVVPNMTRAWHNILSKPHTLAKEGDWLGIYLDSRSLQPKYVVQAREGFTPRMGPAICRVPLAASLFTVNVHSVSLNELEYEFKLRGARWDQHGEDLINLISGYVRRVRVVQVTKGPRKLVTLFFYGRCDQLEWDPNRYKWEEATNANMFLAYSSNMGRRLLKRHHVVPNVIERKWIGVLPLNFKLRWDNVWDKERVSKEAGLIWHRAVAVNEWRSVANPRIP